jgi:hypothetical protein
MTIGEPASWGSCPSEFTLHRLCARELTRGQPEAAHLEGCTSCQERVARMTVPPPPMDFQAVLQVATPPGPSWAKSVLTRCWEAAATAAIVVRELARNEAEAVHLDSCAACRERVVRAPVSPAPMELQTVLAATPGQPSGLKGRRTRWLVAAAATVAMAVLVMAIPPRPDNQTKGTAFTLSLISRGRDGAVRRIEPGERLRAGDQLRFEVSTTWSRAEVALVSMDGRGVVSALAPARGTTATLLGGRRQLLEEAVELDDTPGPERLWLVACTKPMPVAAVAEAARAALSRTGGDPRRVEGLNTGCHEESAWIERVRP